MSFEIIAVESFEKQLKRLAKKYKSLKNDMLSLVESLEENPIQGESLGKDCFKVRLGIFSKGKGKRGGVRLITCVKIVGETVYLLSIYDKAEKEDLVQNELNLLLKLAGI